MISPLGSLLRNRIRMFPSIINCWTINWINQWPDDALKSVAEKKLTNSVENIKSK